MKVSKNLQSYLDSIYVISQSQNTIKTYRTGIMNFNQFLWKQYLIGDDSLKEKIDNYELDIVEVLQQFIIYSVKKGIRSSTIKPRFSAVKGYLRHLGIKIDSDELRSRIKIPRDVKSREIPLTREILVRLLHNANPKLQTAILVAVASGLRLGELASLQVRDIDFECKPTRIYVRAEIAKCKQSRETYLTSEATTALKDHLKQHFGWNEQSKNESIQDKYLFGPVIKPKKNGEFSYQSSIFTLQRSLLLLIRKIPELSIQNENGRSAVHFHAFRKYFRTVVGNACGRDYAEALMGHQFYMDTYYQLSEDKKREMYLDAEPHLTISDFETVEKNIKMLSAKNSQLEEKFNDLLQYLRTNSIEVPNF